MKAILLVVAGLMGAAGITVAALGAHVYVGAGFDIAGNILLFHAAAVLGTVAIIDRGLAAPLVGLLSGSGLVLGSLLFAGDIVLPIYIGLDPFPSAAPIGGTLLIVSWVGIAVAAAMQPARSAA
jgi:uncharacterized membrane protein YgdD (TMEM256/DUF423 family)